MFDLNLKITDEIKDEKILYEKGVFKTIFYIANEK